ncbi:MAG TPA: right-handed parallel beta-helix repeat-containing protein [Pirellulales bacterium]|nr:right-handed parallel beta-helix repeat-containing protein [Pirellulales bacterium]
MSNVRDFGAVGDGRADDTAAIEHALADGEGALEFPPGDYLLSRTIRVELSKTGRFGASGTAGAAKIVMAGTGPAFHVVGTHGKNADPTGFAPGVWQRERMPTFEHLEIEGRNPKASGVLLEGVMQPTFVGVLLRQLEHAIVVRGRARNVLLSACHLYDNRGIGIWFDALNLHQAIVTGSHISYCRRGGIVVTQSEIRNFQITGNDIEYNFDPEAETSADVLLDCRAEGSSIREGTIVSNTIQAKHSPGGANVRFLGPSAELNRKLGMFTIANNVLGSQNVNVHLVNCRGVVVAGNVLYAGYKRNLLVEGSRNIVVSGNSFDHNPDYHQHELATGVRFSNSEGCAFNSNILEDADAGRHTAPGASPQVRDALLEIVDCERMTVSGCQIVDGAPYGVLVDRSRGVQISGCTIVERRATPQMRAAVRFTGAGGGNLVCNNIFGRGLDEIAQVDPSSRVVLEGNHGDTDNTETTRRGK